MCSKKWSFVSSFSRYVVWHYFSVWCPLKGQTYLKQTCSLQLQVCFKDKINPVQLFILTNVIRCSRLPLWVGYFIYLKFTRVSSIVYQSLHPPKETNWLINKGMCVLLFDVFKYLLLRKTDVLKTCRKSKFLGKKIWRNTLALRSKKVHGIFGKTFILVLLSSAVFRLQNLVSDFF